ncbi:MAG TPA: ABC transporter permease [Acidimicrobiia bacterium]|nr:ABC transporter permease [Acidimicrobiia bacterium]
MKLTDLFRETRRSIGERAGRSLVASLGSTLGIATIVAVIGLSGTASNQISVRFDALRSSVVYVEPASLSEEATLREVDLTGLTEVTGVTGVARTTVLNPRDISLRPVDGRIISFTPAVVDGNLTESLELDVLEGRLWDTRILETGAPVAVLGQTVVTELGLPPFTQPFTLWVEGVPVTIIGYVAAGEVDPRIDGWVLTPPVNLDSAIWGTQGETGVLVRVTPGSGASVARQAPMAIDPELPSAFVALAPPEPEVLRAQVEDDTRLAFLVAAGVALIVGTLAIASAVMTSVVERIEQFGIRRALGATRRDIARLVVSESLILGLLGGTAGCVLGLVAILAFSISLNWQPVFDIRLLPLAIGLGGIVGVVAGLLPAIQAGRVDPIRAMRRL